MQYNQVSECWAGSPRQLRVWGGVAVESTCRSFVPGGVSQDLCFCRTLPEISKRLSRCMAQVFFKRLLLSCISPGCELCCLFNGGDSVSSHPLYSPKVEPADF